MIGFILVYGSFFPLLRLLQNDATALESALMRLLGTGVLAAVIEFGFIRSRIQAAGDWVLMGLCGVFSIFVIQILAAQASTLTSTFHATLIMSTVPLQTALLAWLIGREGLWPAKLAGIVIGALGVTGLLMARQQGAAAAMPVHWQGDAMVGVNAFILSGYMLASQVLVRRYSPFTVITYASMVGGVIAAGLLTARTLLPALANVGWLGTLPDWAALARTLTTLPLSAWGILFYLVVLAGIVGYWFSNFALKHAPSSTVASYILLQPLWTALLGVTLLGEAFSPAMIAAGGLTLAGVWLATRPPQSNFRPFYLTQWPPLRWLNRRRRILIGRITRLGQTLSRVR